MSADYLILVRYDDSLLLFSYLLACYFWLLFRQQMLNC